MSLRAGVLRTTQITLTFETCITVCDVVRFVPDAPNHRCDKIHLAQLISVYIKKGALSRPFGYYFIALLKNHTEVYEAFSRCG